MNQTIALHHRTKSGMPDSGKLTGKIYVSRTIRIGNTDIGATRTGGSGQLHSGMSTTKDIQTPLEFKDMEM